MRFTDSGTKECLPDDDSAVAAHGADYSMVHVAGGSAHGSVTVTSGHAMGAVDLNKVKCDIFEYKTRDGRCMACPPSMHASDDGMNCVPAL